MAKNNETARKASYPFSLPPSPPLDVLKGFLDMMWVIRRFEEKSAQVYTLGKIGGFCHLAIGQEAIPVGASHAMASSDTMITAYRSHGHALARGLTAREAMAELMGKYPGCSKGKGGSMHMFVKERQFYGGHGIVGAQTSLGTGMAFSHKYLKDGGVCLTFLGDGASNQGQFFESMNMAALWQLPVLYIIENNGYGMGTSVSRACAGEALFTRGEPFGIPGYGLSGDNVIEVYQVISGALEHIRKTHHPILLELNTYRFKGHSMSDPGKYRTRQDLDEARQSRDPLDRLSAYLIQEHGLSSDDIKASEQHASKIVQDAVEFSDQAPEPPQGELFKDIYL